jgi:hypothetical protein
VLFRSSTWPSSVTTADQDLRGSGWEIGAYIYPVPQAPAIGTPEALSGSSIKWNFTDNSDDETGFKLYDSNNTLKTSQATANLSYLEENSLTQDTNYSGRYVKAYNSYGESVASAIASAITTKGGPGLANYLFWAPKAPEGGFKLTINNGEQVTDNRNITLNLTAGEDTKQMEIADNPDFWFSIKIPFQTTYNWDICKNKTQCQNGEHFVFARFYTDFQLGNPTETVSAKIVLNNETPAQLNEPAGTPQEVTRETILQSMAQILQQIISLYMQLLIMTKG